MSIRIEVKNAVKNSRDVTSKKTGEQFTFYTQPAYAYTSDKAGNPNPYPELMEIDLQKDQEALPVGFYTMHPSSFYVGDFKKLNIGRLVLVPAAVPAALKDSAVSKG